MLLSKVPFHLSWSCFRHWKVLQCVPGAFSSLQPSQPVSIAEMPQPCDLLGGSLDLPKQVKVFLMLGTPELEEHERELEAADGWRPLQ